MLPTVIAAVLLSTAPCTLWGQVDLIRDGKKVDASGRVVVYVHKVAATALRPGNAKKHTIRQIHTEFEPKLLVVQMSDSIEFYNEDKDEHSVFSNAAANTFEFRKSRQGVTGTKTFMFQGPVRIQCDVHPQMRADVLVLQNRFWTFVDPNGTWKISGLPAGSYTVVAWEPNGGVRRQMVTECSGEAAVAIPPLQEEPEQKPKRKNGGAYVEYQD